MMEKQQPHVAALAREALELCDRRPPELLYLREDVRMTELLRDLAHAALPSPSPVVASEQQVAEAMKALDDAVYSWLTATRDAERPWPLPSAAQVRDEAAKEYKAARARLTALLSASPPHAAGIPTEERTEQRQFRSCNRHADCDAAEAKERAGGRISFIGFHCHDDECEDCFGV